jgi:hypothetical protein
MRAVMLAPACRGCLAARVSVLEIRAGSIASVHLAVSWQFGQMTASADRSMKRIEISDLRRLADIAADVEADLFARHPAGSGRYAGRLLRRVLCQGAALHFVDYTNGVKDFDVWSFYAERTDGPFPARWRGTSDFGRSKFGRLPGDPPRYQGRRVDLMGRSLPISLTAHPADALRSYLSAAKTGSARALAAKAAVLIVPAERAGEIIWPERR